MDPVYKLKKELASESAEIAKILGSKADNESVKKIDAYIDKLQEYAQLTEAQGYARKSEHQHFHSDMRADAGSSLAVRPYNDNRQQNTYVEQVVARPTSFWYNISKRLRINSSQIAYINQQESKLILTSGTAIELLPFELGRLNAFLNYDFS